MGTSTSVREDRRQRIDAVGRGTVKDATLLERRRELISFMAHCDGQACWFDWAQPAADLRLVFARLRGHRRPVARCATIGNCLDSWCSRVLAYRNSGAQDSLDPKSFKIATFPLWFAKFSSIGIRLAESAPLRQSGGTIWIRWASAQSRWYVCELHDCPRSRACCVALCTYDRVERRQQQCVTVRAMTGHGGRTGIGARRLRRPLLDEVQPFELPTGAASRGGAMQSASRWRVAGRALWRSRPAQDEGHDLARSHSHARLGRLGVSGSS